jgi:tetratricopeptide (TPR) repeat protein
VNNELEKLIKQVEELFPQDKYKEIVDLLSDDVLEKYQDARLYAWRTRAHFRQNADSELIMYFAEKAIGLDANYFMGYIARGNARGAKNEYENAIADYTKAIELKPDYADTYYDRGHLRNELGIESDEAKTDFERYLELISNRKDHFSIWTKDFIQEPDEKIKDVELNHLLEVL